MVPHLSCFKHHFPRFIVLGLGLTKCSSSSFDVFWCIMHCLIGIFLLWLSIMKQSALGDKRDKWGTMGTCIYLPTICLLGVFECHWEYTVELKYCCYFSYLRSKHSTPVSFHSSLLVWLYRTLQPPLTGLFIQCASINVQCTQCTTGV